MITGCVRLFPIDRVGSGTLLSSSPWMVFTFCINSSDSWNPLETEIEPTAAGGWVSNIISEPTRYDDDEDLHESLACRSVNRYRLHGGWMEEKSTLFGL